VTPIIRKTYLLQIASALVFALATVTCFAAVGDRLLMATNIITMAANGVIFMRQFGIRDRIKGHARPDRTRT